MNQWFIFGLNGVGKSWFLKNKKCEDITKYKWNSEDTFSNILQRLKERGFQQLDKYITSTPLMMIEVYKRLIELLNEQNISYTILNSSNEKYNIIDESEIETIIGL